MFDDVFNTFDEVSNTESTSYYSTYYIEENILKKEVEKLFGKGSYNKADFVINFSEEYIYDENSSRYVLDVMKAEALFWNLLQI